MIFRELVTLLSFKIDFTSFDKIEKFLKSFKVKTAAAFFSVDKIVSKFLNWQSSIADAAVSTKDLADYAGIAVKDFVALKTAAEKLAVKPENFNAAIEKLAISLKEAKVGAGQLFDVFVQTRGKISFKDANKQLKTTKQLLLDIADWVKNNPLERSEQLRVLGNLFSPDSAGEWLRFLERGSQEIERLAKKEESFSENFENSVQAAILFKKEMAAVNVEWNKLNTALGNIFLPYVSQALGGISDILEELKLFEVPEKVVNFLKTYVKPLIPNFGHIVQGEFPGYEDPREREHSDFFRKIQEEQTRSILNNAASVQSTNNFTFNVPQGTTEQQGSYMADMVKMAQNSFWDEKVREVITNYPQVE